MPLPLTTPRLVLRAFTEHDLAAFCAYRSDPEVARYQSWETPYTDEQARTLLEQMAQTKLGTPGAWIQIAVEERATGLLLGDVALCPFENDPRIVEMGVTLAHASQKQGFGTEAVRCLLDFLFDELGAHRVIAHCDVLNTASARLLERVGMRREGTFYESVWFKGRWSSEHAYALLQSER